LGREPRLTSRVSFRQQSANYDRSLALAYPPPSLRHVCGPKAPTDDCPFRKFHPAEIRVVRQNHRIILIDVCDPARTRYVHLRSAQVSVPARRQLLWFEVTRHPPAEGPARQITEAFPWASAPAYLVGDNDRVFGQVFTSRVRAMGIRDRPILPPVTVAKWVRESPDRNRASRVPGPNTDLRRGTPAASSCFVCGVLQSGANVHAITERCALASSSSTIRNHYRGARSSIATATVR
jgi:hypothetical protein